MLTSRQCFSLGLVALVITTSFIPTIEAGRIKSGSRKSPGGGGGKGKPRPSSYPSPSTPNRAPNAGNVALSYPTYNSNPARPQSPPATAPKAPAAPAPGWNTNAAAPAAQPANNGHIGWNTNQQQAGGIQKATATQNNNAPPAYSPNAGAGGYNPPPYSAGHPNGPPPAYSPNQYPGGHGAPPPAYSPNGHGYPQQPQYNNNPGSYGQQPNYHPQGNNYAGGGYHPQQQPGGFGGGYPQQQPGGFGGGYGGYGGQPQINNYYGQKSGGGLGLTNALLLGVGGLSLYNAFKPGETKTIYINNSTNPEDARQVSNNGTHVLVSDTKTTVATPLAPFPDHCGQYMNMPVPPQQQQVTTPTPLAPMPAAVVPETPLAPLPAAVVPETTTTAPAETTTITGTEGVTEVVPLAPLPDQQPQTNVTNVAPVVMPSSNVTVPVVPNVTTVPQIPNECLPFVTGQVLPSNYTGPPLGQPAFGQAPNPNIQYGNPQWQQQAFAPVPVAGVQQSGQTSGAEKMWGMSYAAMIVVTMVARFA